MATGGALLIDQGSHASRACLARADGGLTDPVSVEIAASRSASDRCEHDPEEMVASVRGAVADVLAGSRNEPLSAAGIATQRSTIVCWDRKTGRALSPVISWQDRRGAGWLERLGPDPEEVRRITGLVPSPHYGASKLRWCLDHLPEVRRARDEARLCMGPLSSFLLFRCLEERPFVVDPANASRTLLWDFTRGDWSSVMLEHFGIPGSCLPGCVASRYDFGTLESQGRTVPVQVCTGDQAAALFAFGEPRPDTAYVNMGTGAFVQRAVRGRPPEVPGLLQSVAWQEEGRTTGVLEGTVNGAGSALEWLSEASAVPQQTLLDSAEDWLAGASRIPLFINGVGGLGAPFWKPACPVQFVGAGDVAGQTVAVLESIVFLLAANLEVMRSVLGPESRIVVSGGLARLDGLCRRLADVAAVPVERPAGTEATAAGLARLVTGRSLATSQGGQAFEPGENAGLAARYQRWREALSVALSE
ncbi:MAG: FGGY family carbohydrate kinase [Gammaproteobacteria bacterium]